MLLHAEADLGEAPIPETPLSQMAPTPEPVATSKGAAIVAPVRQSGGMAATGGGLGGLSRWLGFKRSLPLPTQEDDGRPLKAANVATAPPSTAADSHSARRGEGGGRANDAPAGRQATTSGEQHVWPAVSASAEAPFGALGEQVVKQSDAHLAAAAPAAHAVDSCDAPATGAPAGAAAAAPVDGVAKGVATSLADAGAQPSSDVPEESVRTKAGPSTDSSALETSRRHEFVVAFELLPGSAIEAEVGAGAAWLVVQCGCDRKEVQGGDRGATC